MQWLLSPPEPEDFIRLLQAWRFWLIGALAGALAGAALYAIAPPPYRAGATVVVDFNLEQAWPQDTDRQQFYYLERETRKLEEVAWSDAVMQAVAAATGTAQIEQLRDGKLQLSQPGDGGWHFYANDRDPQKAAALASAWARLFDEQVQAGVQTASINPYVQTTVTQAGTFGLRRRVDMSAYVLAGSAASLGLGALIILLLPGSKPGPASVRGKTPKARAKKK